MHCPANLKELLYWSGLLNSFIFMGLNIYFHKYYLLPFVLKFFCVFFCQNWSGVSVWEYVNFFNLLFLLERKGKWGRWFCSGNILWLTLKLLKLLMFLQLALVEVDLGHSVYCRVVWLVAHRLHALNCSSWSPAIPHPHCSGWNSSQTLGSLAFLQHLLPIPVPKGRAAWGAESDPWVGGRCGRGRPGQGCRHVMQQSGTCIMHWRGL